MNIYIHTYHTSIISVSYQYHTNINIILIYINIPDIHTRYTCIIQESTHFILCPSFYFKTEVPTISLSENMVEVPVSLVHEKVVEVATWSRSNCRSKERRLKLAWKHNMKTIQYSRHIWYYIYMTFTYRTDLYNHIQLLYFNIFQVDHIVILRCSLEIWNPSCEVPQVQVVEIMKQLPKVMANLEKTTHGGNNTTFP